MKDLGTRLYKGTSIHFYQKGNRVGWKATTVHSEKLGAFVTIKDGITPEVMLHSALLLADQAHRSIDLSKELA